MAQTTLAASAAHLRSLLGTGPLLTVPVAAELVFGHRICTRTAYRWEIPGRRGMRLPTVIGVGRTRLTTVAALRAWLEMTSGEPTPVPAPVAADEAADAILAAISPKLARKGKGAKQ